MPWVLAIDFGTTSTSVAIRVGERVELVEIDGSPRMPSMVFWRDGSGGQTGRLMIGAEAENLAGRAPWALERTPKRRLGDEFMLLGDQEVRVTDAVAAILRTAAAEAIRRRGGESPTEVRLTYPARWGAERLAKLRKAAQVAGLDAPRFIPEPVAAATHFASEKLEPGQHVAVYDLGGGTFDTAILRRSEDGFEVVGVPGGREDLGGEDFDDTLYRHLGAQLDPEHWNALRTSEESVWRQTNLQLLREARKAKETLSRSPDYDVYVPPPVDAYIQVTADELQGLIAADIDSTVEELERTIVAAGLDPTKLAAIYLAGGSSRIPLVARLIERRFGQPPDYLDDPKSVIALGAARAQQAGTAADAADAAGTAGAKEAALGVPTVASSQQVAEPHDRTILEQTVVRQPPAAAQPAAAHEASRPPAPADEPKLAPASGGSSRRVWIGVGGGVLVAALAAALVIASSGGGHKKVRVTPPKTTPTSVSETAAKRLLSQFETTWDEADTGGFSKLMTHGVAVSYPSSSGPQSVTGLENVESSLKSEFFAGSGSHDLVFEGEEVAADAEGTSLVASYTSTQSEDIGGPGTVKVGFLAADPASPPSSPCHSGPCISRMSFTAQSEASGGSGG